MYHLVEYTPILDLPFSISIYSIVKGKTGTQFASITEVLREKPLPIAYTIDELIENPYCTFILSSPTEITEEMIKQTYPELFL